MIKPWMIGLLSCCLMSPAWAQTPLIEVDPSDTPLEITGWLGEAETLAGSVRLKSAQPVEQFTVLASDLDRQEGDEEIARQQVTVTGDRTLAAGIPQDVQVQVASPDLPGTYTGRLQIIQANQPTTTVPLTLRVKARPNLAPLQEQLDLHLVRSEWFPNNLLARLLLPESAFLSTRLLQFRNPGGDHVSVQTVAVSLIGEQTGYPLDQTQIQPVVPAVETAASEAVDSITLPAQPLVGLPFRWSRSQIPPDHYVGLLYLFLDGAEAPLEIPVSLTMRIGPLVPLLVLLLGVGLGRLLKYIQDQGIPQAETLAQVRTLAAEIQTAHPADQEILQPMLAEAERQVQAQALESAIAQVTQVKARWLCLQRLRQLEQQLQGINTRQVQGEGGILKQIQAARLQLKLGNDAEAQNQLAAIQTALVDLKPPEREMGDRQPLIDLPAVSQQMMATIQAARNVLDTYVGPPVTQGVTWTRRTLDWLTGTEFRMEVNYRLAKPLFSLALLIGFSVVGMRSLYVEKGETFGANPFTDYLGLLVWGLTTDVTSRSLSALMMGKTREE